MYDDDEVFLPKTIGRLTRREWSCGVRSRAAFKFLTRRGGARRDKSSRVVVASTVWRSLTGVQFTVFPTRSTSLLIVGDKSIGAFILYCAVNKKKMNK